MACVRPLFKIVVQWVGWSSEDDFRPSVPLGGGRGPNAANVTIGGSKRTRRTDTFHMASLFSRTDNAAGGDGDGDDDDESADAHSVGSASTTKLVGAGGIMKTSAFTVQVEERPPVPPVPAMLERGGPSDGTEHLGRVYSG